MMFYNDIPCRLKGYGLTNGMTAYVPIPKNGWQSHRELFLIEEGWEGVNFENEVVTLPTYIVIRDPVARWFAGAYQRAVMFNEDKPYGQLVREALDGGPLVIDEHTVPQTDYLLPTLKVRNYVRLEKAAEYVADNWGLTLPKLNHRPWRGNSALVPIIREAYAADVELYESLN